MNTVRNTKGPSSYFRGNYRHYGRYQWEIKYSGFESQDEIESAVNAFFGHYDYKNGEFDLLSECVGRSIKASTQGRSGGWLVIDTELTDDEISIIDQFVSGVMESLPEFLAELRQERADDLEQERLEMESRRTEITADFATRAALIVLRDRFGSDFCLTIKGIKVSE